MIYCICSRRSFWVFGRWGRRRDYMCWGREYRRWGRHREYRRWGRRRDYRRWGRRRDYMCWGHRPGPPRNRPLFWCVPGELHVPQSRTRRRYPPIAFERCRDHVEPPPRWVVCRLLCQHHTSRDAPLHPPNKTSCFISRFSP